MFQFKTYSINKTHALLHTKIYHVYDTTQWNVIILRKFSQLTLTSPNEKRMRVADTVRRFCNFLL